MIANVGSAIVNAIAGKQVCEPSDFIIDFEKAAKQPKHETPEDIVRKLKAAGFPVVIGERK